jgi:hypothetical protein
VELRDVTVRDVTVRHLPVMAAAPASHLLRSEVFTEQLRAVGAITPSTAMRVPFELVQKRTLLPINKRPGSSV